MKKWLLAILIAIIVIIIALALFLPLVFGKLVETHLKNLPSSDEFKFEIIDYHRGWFSSDATIKVSLINPNTAQLSQFGFKGEGIIQFTTHEHIIHGPIIFANTDSGSRLLLGQAFATGKVQQDNINITNSVWIKLNGDIESKITSPQASAANPKLKTYSGIKNLNVVVNMTRDMQKVLGNIEVAEVTFIGPTAKQTFFNTAAKYDLSKTPEGILVGRRDIQLGGIAYTNLTNNKNVMSKNLHITSQSFGNKGRINISMQVSLDSVTVDNKSYGPHNIALDVNNIDAKALHTLAKEAYNFHNRNDLAAQIAQSLQILQYNQLLVTLFSKGMQIDLKKLDLTTGWGNVSANGHITFEPLEQETFNPFVILQKAQANINMVLPKDLLLQVLTRRYENDQSIQNPAQQAQTQINEWINNRWLLPIDRSYKVNFVYKDKISTINGAPFPKPKEAPASAVTAPAPAPTPIPAPAAQ